MKKVFIPIIGAIAILISYPAFGQSYFLNGSATSSGGDCYTLTQDTPNQNGDVWYANQVDLSQDFDISFKMNFGSNDTNGADGMVFVFQTAGTSALGNSGGGMGFLGFSPSFGIEFDTYQNLTPYGDPVYDHIAFISNGSVNHTTSSNIAGPVPALPDSGNIEDGQDHVIRIKWDPASDSISVYFDCIERLSKHYNIPQQIFGGATHVYWGFTGGTGALTNTQTVCLQNNILPTASSVDICQGDSIQINAPGDPTSTFAWSPNIALTDSSIQSPYASPDTTTLYTVQYQDLCGNYNTDTVNVIVHPLIPSVAINGSLSCLHPQVDLSASNNFNPNADYYWLNGNGDTLGAQTSSFQISQPGSYTLIVSYHNNACMGHKNFTIQGNFTTPYVTVSLDTSLTCYHPQIDINSTVDDPTATIGWTGPSGGIVSGANSTTATVQVNGVYVFTATNTLSGCHASDSLYVSSDITPPLVTPQPVDTISCNTPVVSLTLDTLQESHLQITWSSDLDSTLQDSSGTQVRVNQPGQYVAHVFNPVNGCAIDEYFFAIENAQALFDPNNVVIPNTFSPNGDGKNEVFGPILKTQPQLSIAQQMNPYRLEIYDRWGKKVFESSGTSRYWDGSVNGHTSADGTYFYLMQYQLSCLGTAKKDVSGTVRVFK